jgi:hypothetical protein
MFYIQELWGKSVWDNAKQWSQKPRCKMIWDLIKSICVDGWLQGWLDGLYFHVTVWLMSKSSTVSSATQTAAQEPQFGFTANLFHFDKIDIKFIMSTIWSEHFIVLNVTLCNHHHDWSRDILYFPQQKFCTHWAITPVSPLPSPW